MSKVYDVAQKYFTKVGDVRRMKDILKNASRPVCVDGKPVMCPAEIPLDMLRFPEYQKDRLRNINEEKIYLISNDFSVCRAGYVEVIPNMELGLFEVSDGMGRTIAADMAGIEYIQANIHLNVPQSEISKTGARLFSDQYSGVRPMKPSHQHTAKLILGDPIVKTLDKVAKKHNVIVTPSKDDRESGTPYVKSYSDVFDIAKVNGEEGLEFAFKVIKNAGWNIETYGYASYVLRTMKYIYQAYRGEKNIVIKLGKILRDFSPTGFNEAAHLKYPNREHRTACVLYADDLLAKQLKENNRIYYAGNKIKIGA